jgi:AraC-like DNA-binding protein
MALPIRVVTDIDDPRQPDVLTVQAENGRARIVRRHTHCRGQLLLVADGMLAVESDAGRWLAPAGTAFWIPPRRDHSLLIHGGCAGWAVYLVEALCRELPANPGAAPGTPLLREAVARHASFCRVDGERHAAVARRLGAVIVDEIGTLAFADAFLPMPQSPRVLQIARIVMADPADNRPLSLLAEQVGLSRRSATRRFTAETGVPFTLWRQRLRLMRAMEQLSAGSSVLETALSLGYESPSAFTAMFRRQMGSVPSRARGKGIVTPRAQLPMVGAGQT